MIFSKIIKLEQNINSEKQNAIDSKKNGGSEPSPNFHGFRLFDGKKQAYLQVNSKKRQKNARIKMTDGKFGV